MPLKPKQIGVIGGGQLGQKLIESTLPLNHNCIILDPDENCPSAGIAKIFIKGNLKDRDAIFSLASSSDVLTFEIENINTDALIELEKNGKKIIPSPRILQIIQDKSLQKQFLEKNSLPTSLFRVVNNKEELEKAISLFNKFSKVVVKASRGGYDGKGVQIIDTESLSNFSAFQYPFIVEQFINCAKEISIIVARNQKGEIVCFPSVEMVFDPSANLVDYLISPARIKKEIEITANKLARNVVEKLDGIGIFAVEMFLDENDNLYVNEIAPRPHNSGHHTIEACYTSQYEQLLRILLELPLGNVDAICPAIMVNILGPNNYTGPYQLANPEKLFEVDRVYLHLYGKKETSPKRKLGHITILANTVEEALNKMNDVKKYLEIKPYKNEK